MIRTDLEAEVPMVAMTQGITSRTSARTCAGIRSVSGTSYSTTSRIPTQIRVIAGRSSMNCGITKNRSGAINSTISVTSATTAILVIALAVTATKEAGVG